MADPVLHLPHQLLANIMVLLCLGPIPSDHDDMRVAVMRDEVLPAAVRGASPLADRLISAAEGLCAAHAGRGARGEPSLIWAVCRSEAERALASYFSLRAGQGLDRLRQTPGEENAA